MEHLLRHCYANAGIIGANAAVFEMRNNAIKKIMEDRLLDEGEWQVLAEWLIGIQSDGTENILIKLEQSFCREDKNFSLENGKEVQILASVLVYQYSKKKNSLKIPCIVICGCHGGNMIASKYVYQLFVEYMDGKRLAIRHIKRVDKGEWNIGADRLKRTIARKKKEFKQQQEEFSYQTEDIDLMVNSLTKCELVLQNFQQRVSYLSYELAAQREEANIAWWLLNEWSDIYHHPFSELKPEEAALAIPIELWRLNEFAVGAYAGKQVVFKGVSFLKGKPDTISLEKLAKAATGKVYSFIDIEKLAIGAAQPILMALKCAYEYKDSPDENVWRAVFETKCQRKPGQIQMSVRDMAYQLYLELELACLEG